MQRVLIVILLGMVSLYSACSLKGVAVDMTADIIADGAPAFEEENDLELAEQAIAGNLKLLEGLLKSSPENKTLLVLLSKSYGGYAFAFVQDEYEKTQYASPKRAEAYKNRAENFYLRGKDYAMRYLSEEDSDFKEALNADFLSFEKAVKDFDEDDVPALFWGAYNWGNWLNMNLDDPAAFVVTPKVESMMARVLALDENFYYGGPHLFYGAYYAARPAMLGGNIKKAKVHFDKALKLNKRKFLIVQVLYAQYYAVQTQNKKLFRTLLKEVLTADDDIFPEQSLITQLAKRKARRLLKQQNKLF